MTLFWGPRGDMWQPQGGREVPMRDLSPGDLIELGRELFRVAEAREVPVTDWDDEDEAAYAKLAMRVRTEPREAFRYRPVYLILEPAKGGQHRHVKGRPYRSWTSRGKWVVPEHHPVCSACGELYPCRDLEIEAETAREMANLAQLEGILPGSCWGCGNPVTARQKSIVFEGENLLLPGGPPVVFHLRRDRHGCASAAVTYDKRWVKAEAGRHPRLHCPGKLIIHIDGPECSEDPYCPGPGVNHPTYMNHRYGGYRCLRCTDAYAQQQAGLIADEPPAS